jgi:hypothetical protein
MESVRQGSGYRSSCLAQTFRRVFCSYGVLFICRQCNKPCPRKDGTQSQFTTTAVSFPPFETILSLQQKTTETSRFCDEKLFQTSAHMEVLLWLPWHINQDFALEPNSSSDVFLKKHYQDYDAAAGNGNLQNGMKKLSAVS